MTHTHKIILFLLIIAVISAGIGTLLYYQKNLSYQPDTGANADIADTQADTQQNVSDRETTEDNSPTQAEPESITSDIDTSDWLTYRNEEYGFNLKYPKTTSVGVEYGSEVDQVNRANEFYVSELYVIVADTEGFDELDGLINNKVGIDNYDRVMDITDGRIVKIWDDKNVSFMIKDGHKLNTVLYSETEMAFIIGGNFNVWITSRIGSTGDGKFSEEEKAIIESFKIQ